MKKFIFVTMLLCSTVLTSIHSQVDIEHDGFSPTIYTPVDNLYLVKFNTSLDSLERVLQAKDEKR